MVSNTNKRFKSGAVATAQDDGGSCSSRNQCDDENHSQAKQRSEGLHDVHGIANLPAETEEMISTKITEKNEVLSSSYIDLAADASAYRRAMSMDADFVEQLKLPCLRSMQYNSRQAAALLLRLFDQKSILFGQERLVKDIGLGDLTERDREALSKGIKQILPHHDRAGRRVLFNWGTLGQDYEAEVLLRVTFFMAMLLVRRDEECQKRGIVYLHFAFNIRSMPPKRMLLYHKLWSSLPLRLAAIHMCREESGRHGVLSHAYQVLQKAMVSKHLVRLRIHCGSEMECMYKLMTFGILKDGMPTHSGCNQNLKDHLEMIHALETSPERNFKTVNDYRSSAQQEEASCQNGKSRDSATSSATTSILLSPGPKDIIMGRGRRPTNNEGSRLMYQFVNEMKVEYALAIRRKKNKIVNKILKSLKEQGYRFVKETAESGFVACDDTVAKAKIAHSFRNEKSRSQSIKHDNKRNRRGVENGEGVSAQDVQTSMRS